LIVDASAGSVTVKGRIDWIVSGVPLVLLSAAVVPLELFCEAEVTTEEADVVNEALFADGEVPPVELDGAVSLLAQPTKRTPSRLMIATPIIILFFMFNITSYRRVLFC
jgi:hypothetical protein